MNRRTCPGCSGRSYSSCSGTNWDCPYCGRDLGRVPDELSGASEKSKEKKPTSIKFHMIKGGKREKYVSSLS